MVSAARIKPQLMTTFWSPFYMQTNSDPLLPFKFQKASENFFLCWRWNLHNKKSNVQKLEWQQKMPWVNTKWKPTFLGLVFHFLANVWIQTIKEIPREIYPVFIIFTIFFSTLTNESYSSSYLTNYAFRHALWPSFFALLQPYSSFAIDKWEKTWNLLLLNSFSMKSPISLSDRFLNDPTNFSPSGLTWKIIILYVWKTKMKLYKKFGEILSSESSKFVFTSEIDLVDWPQEDLGRETVRMNLFFSKDFYPVLF